jgi:hypothetical protein
MGSKNSAPEAPDPRETSAAQTGTSVATALANAALGNVNQVGADGSTLNYDQTGSYSFTDPYTGKSYDIPTFTATQQLSDIAQGIYDTNQQTQQNLANIGQDQSSFLQGYMGEPWQADTSDIESHLFDLGANTLDPKFEQQRSDLTTRLSNQGIKLGSAAYDRAMSQMQEGQTSAYNDLALRGRGQAFNELQAQRNQPINEISALMSGSQVSMPNYGINQPSQIPTTDNAGLINNAYMQDLTAWQQDQANRGGMLGGLFQLGGTLGSAYITASDERVKTDIKKVGKTDDGQQIYSYRYKSGGPIQMGLMAQEVEKKKPEAVKEIGGIKHVNYAIALGK